jgi:hypothetical protein
VPVVAAGVVGALAVVGGIIGGAIQGRIARDQRAHDLTVRHEERMMQQRQTLYVELLTTVLRANQAMERTAPMMTPAPQLPDAPSEDEQRVLIARINAFGSADVRALVRQWQAVLPDFGATASTVIELERRRGGGGVMLTESDAEAMTAGHLRLHELRQQAHALFQQMSDQANAELTAAPTPTTSG